MYPKVCPKIREAIFSGVEAAARTLKYNNSKPKPALLCGKCSSELSPHAATIATDHCYLMCTKSKSYEPLTKQHTVWFDVKPSTAHFTKGKQNMLHFPSNLNTYVKSSTSNRAAFSSMQMVVRVRLPQLREWIKNSLHYYIMKVYLCLQFSLHVLYTYYHSSMCAVTIHVA